jgi:hypothetical protein
MPQGLFPAFERQGDAVNSAVRRKLMTDVSRSNGGTLSDIAWLLDTPGSVVRGTISGLADGDPLKGVRALQQTDDERISGRELNQQLGLDPTPGERTWTNFGTGLATEMLTDPLSYVSGPVKALTPAGKIAAKAGLLEQAPEILSRQFLAGQAAPEVADAASRTVKAIGREVSPTDILGRPLVGRRQALRSGTLGDLIDYAADPDQAREGVLGALRGNTDQLEKLRSQKLGKSFGLGLPFMDPSVAFDDPIGVGKTLGDLQDAAGQALRWSAPGRAYNMLTNNDVGGAFTANDQMISAGTNLAKRRASQAARRDATFQAAKLQQSEPDVFSEEGNRALGRLIEKPTVNKLQSVDDIWDSDHPAARAYMDWWEQQSKQANQSFTEVGLRGVNFQDTNIQGYLPRKAEGMLEMAGSRDPSLGRQLSSLTSDQLQRADEMMVPGGRDTLAFDLSKDPFVAGGKRQAGTDQQAAQHIAEKLYGKRFPVTEDGFSAFDREYKYGTRYWTKNASGDDVFSPSLSSSEVHKKGAFGTPAIDQNGNEVNWADPGDHQDLFIEPGKPSYSPQQMKRAMTLAQLLHKLPDHLIKDVPLFGQHPVEMITRYMEGRAGAEAVQGSLYDSLAYMSQMTPADLVGGGKHISMKEALARIGARTVQDGDEVLGGAVQMRGRLAGRFKADADSIELSTFSVPEEAVDRLVRARDAYTQPEGASRLMEGLTAYNAAWKSNILSWPSRIVRDLYSGAYSNWLEGALSKRGTFAAKGLLSNGPEDQSFVRALAKMPLYGGGADDAVARFWADLDATGLMKSSVAGDRGLIVSGGNLIDSLPGAMPDTFAGAASELGSQPGRSWMQYLDDIRPTIDRNRLERNPLVRAGARAGNLSDRINRLGGYIELLVQGVAPQEAARRMMRAHVDYGSLTPYERKLRDTVMPFYAYFSRSMREVLRQLAERPGGRYGQGIRTYEELQEPEEGQYVPSSVRKNFAAKLPSDSFFAPSDPSVTRYLSDVDLSGYDQLNMIRPRDLRATANEIAGQANPLWRTLYETLISGRDSFTNRPLDQFTRGPVNKIVQAATGQEGVVNPMLEKGLELVPGVSRPLRAVANFVDPNLPIGYGSRALSGVVNNMTGVKFRDFTQDDLDRDAIRRLEELAQPYTSEHSTQYIPEARKPFVPQEALDQVDMAAQLRQRLKASGHRARLSSLRN